jgi:hypothetical protein
MGVIYLNTWLRTFWFTRKNISLFLNDFMAPPIPMLFIFLKKPDTFFPLFSTVMAFTITFSKCLLSLLLLMLP